MNLRAKTPKIAFVPVGLALLACSCGSTGGSDAAGPLPSSNVAGAGGAGGEAGAGFTATRRICDGSADIRLAVFALVSPTTVRVFTPLLYESGFGFLYVDGRCRFWAQQPSLPSDNYLLWRPYREGTLTDAQETALHDAVSYDDFTQAPACVGTLPTDGAPIVVWDGEKKHFCRGQLQAADDWPMREELFAAGTALTGPVRVVVGQDYVPDKAPVYAWPLAERVDAHEVSYDQGSAFGQSTLVTSPADAAALRKLRDKAIEDAEAAPGRFFGLIFVEPKGYVAVIRDDLPFTNPSDGLWSPS